MTPTVDFTQPTPILDLLAHEFPPVSNYIEPEILTKGGTLLLGGEAKAGKSFVMAEAIRALTTGTNFMYNELFKVPAPVKVLYIEAENGARTNKNRLGRILKDDDPAVYGPRLWVTSKNMDLNFNDRASIMRVVKVIQDLKPNVLILDPISFMYHEDENSNTMIGKLFKILAVIKEVGKEEELSIIFSHHFGKPPVGPAAKNYVALSEYNFRGASKWKDGGDSIITMHRHNTKKLPYEHWKFKARFLLRHGSSPPDSIYTVNYDNDFKVKFERWSDEVPMELENKERKRIEDNIKREKITMETVEGQQKVMYFEAPIEL